MKAYIMLKIHVGEIPQVVRHLSRIDGVKEAHMTFGPYDAVAVINTPDIAKLGKILSEEIQPIPGVIETLTCMAVDA